MSLMSSKAASNSWTPVSPMLRAWFLTRASRSFKAKLSSSLHIVGLLDSIFDTDHALDVGADIGRELGHVPDPVAVEILLDDRTFVAEVLADRSQPDDLFLGDVEELGGPH